MPKTFLISVDDLSELADSLISDCCIEGIRNAGGRYARIADDPIRLRRLLAKRLQERLADLCTETVTGTIDKEAGYLK